jgi:spore maturation protein CgeB
MTIHPAVYGKEVITTYAEHLVVVDGRADFGLGEKRFRRDTSNMRIFEATRSGSLLIEEYAPNLEQMFDIGKEILCYHSDEELFDLVRFYCSAEHSSLSAKIARAGQRRATVSHSMEIRAQQFEDIITKELI